MLLIALFLIAFYVLAVYYTLNNFIKWQEIRAQGKVFEAKKTYHALVKVKEDATKEKTDLEKKAVEIFTLFEMTKAMTQKVKAEEAFEVFKNRLNQSMVVKECRFVDTASPDYEKLQSSPEYFNLSLKSKREKLGLLLFKGLKEEDKDTAVILGQQLALALQRTKLYGEIEELAITDSLTGAHTRRHFLERFEEELKRSTARKIDLSLLMIDVDYFKNINDKHGHLVGDKILQGIGKLIKENVREIDIIGRYGGEEFCVVLPVTDRYGANFAAERIRSAIEETLLKAYDTTLAATVSIGIATYPVDGKTAAEILDKADWALYRAKKKGRNCICAFGVYE